MLQRLRNLITVSCFAQLHPLPPLERTSKKGNANKSQINWKAKKKKSMRPLTPRRRGEVIIWFFWGDSFVFLLAGLQSQTASLLPTSTQSQRPTAFDLLLLPQQSQQHADAGIPSWWVGKKNRCKLGQCETVTPETSLSKARIKGVKLKYPNLARNSNT